MKLKNIIKAIKEKIFKYQCSECEDTKHVLDPWFEPEICPYCDRDYSKDYY